MKTISRFERGMATDPDGEYRWYQREGEGSRVWQAQDVPLHDWARWRLEGHQDAYLHGDYMT